MRRHILACPCVFKAVTPTLSLLIFALLAFRPAPTGNLLSAAGNEASTTISMSGWGQLRFGATASTLTSVLGGRLPTDANCQEMSVAGNLDTRIMFENRILMSLSTEDKRLRTTSGFRVGSLESSVRRALRRPFETKRNMYEESGFELVQYSADRTRAFVFVTDGRRVQSIRAGMLPSVLYIEGCL